MFDLIFQNSQQRLQHPHNLPSTQVDGTYNHLIHSVKFPKFPIKCAKFLCDGGKFVVGSSQYNHFYMYDLEAAQETKIPSNLGRDGHNMKVHAS